MKVRRYRASAAWLLTHGLALAVAAGAGCKSNPPCVTMSGPPELFAAAQRLRVDVYDSTAHCDAASGTVPLGSAAPILSRTFSRGDALSLQVAPGAHAIVLTTYSDEGATQLIGSGCSESTVKPGGALCLAITLVPGPDGGDGRCHADADCVGDQLRRCAPDGRCVACLPDGDDCAGKPATPLCNPIRYQCVQCLSTADCSGGQVCSDAGVCSQRCDATTPGSCPAGQTCCSNVCVDTRSDPLNCNGCGMPCTGGATLCCNGECADPNSSASHCGGCGTACSTLNGTPTCSSGACAWTCNANFIHCGSGNTGCETASNTTSNCGGCGNVCTPTHALTNACDNATSCNYGCEPLFADCVRIGADGDGCETPIDTVMNCGGCGNVCDPLGTALTPTCSGTTCVYAGCMAGRADCNAGTAPNVDGCECATTLCCPGNTCQPQHDNGLGGTYLSGCDALGAPGNASTYTVTMANAASMSWASGGTPGTKTCGNGAMAADCVTNTNGGTCATWCYTKTVSGHVATGATCTCPTGSSPTWN